MNKRLKFIAIVLLIVAVLFLFFISLSNRSTAINTPDNTASAQIKSPTQTTQLIIQQNTVESSITPEPTQPSILFDGNRAYQDVLAQMEFGPRLPDSAAHQKTIDYIQDELVQAGWTVDIQETENSGHPIKNIIAKKGNSGEWVILGAHYDSRLYATYDPDPALQNQPVPGANDGASGVAVLLEIARVLPKDINKQVWLVFFDAEDQGKIEGWDWILGSRSFVGSLQGKPDAVVIIDMIGDSDLNLYREISSDKELTTAVWNTAKELGYQTFFIDEEKYSILDDHLPFLEAGIPAIDIIDFDYPYWHTVSDTADKVSAESLSIVGNTLLAWLGK